MATLAWVGYLAAFAGGFALAQQTPAAPSPAKPAPASPAPASPAQAKTAPAGKREPVLLSADRVTSDDEHGLVTARGNVELSQGARTVRADAMTYNRNSKVVMATGHVRMVETSGDVLFADYAELTDDMRDAFVTNVRVLMTDNGRMAGNEGERRGGRLTRVDHGVYSPCDLCPTDPTRAPLWQIRGERIVHDDDDHEVRYKDAVMEMFGVPVFYAPFLAHPDPSVDRKSGFLFPTFGGGSELGAFVRPRYYLDIAPDQDATFELGVFSNQLPQIGGQYRKRFEDGYLQIDASGTRSSLTNGQDNTYGPLKDVWRGHVFAKGRYEFDDVWRAGFDYRHASDPNYLRRYYHFREDYLTSRAYVEGFQGRDYVAVNAYDWQDMIYNFSTVQPVVAPLATYNALGEPASFLGGRMSLDAGAMATYRKVGMSSRRLSFQPGWRGQYVTGGGLITTIQARTLLAGYSALHYPEAGISGGPTGSTQALNPFPQGQIELRYPMVRYANSSYQIVEPITQFTAAPRTGTTGQIPNEDSLEVEFDEANLFQLNRFPGIDRQEGGMRFTYGLRAGHYGNTQGGIGLIIGQSYRFNTDANFATGSGLVNRLSDVVGRIDVMPYNWLDLSYGFRLDSKTLTPHRNTFTGAVSQWGMGLSAAYSFVDQAVNTTTGVTAPSEQVTLGFSAPLTQRWSMALVHIENFLPKRGPRVSQAVLSYQDECYTFQTIARRDFTTPVGETNQGFGIFFRMVFKNVGEVQTPSLTSGATAR